MMYSNFSNYTHVRTDFENINTTSPYGNLDTLDFTQISQSTGITFSLSPQATEKYRHNINLSVNYQVASQNQTDNPNHAGSRFINSMAGYNFGLLKPGLTLATNFNYSRNIADSLTTVLYGPTISARKALLDKKMNLSASFSYNNTELNKKRQAGVFISRISAGYVIKERHAFDLGAVYANRKNFTKSTSTNEITVTLTYRYNFSLLKKKQEAAVQTDGSGLR